MTVSIATKGKIPVSFFSSEWTSEERSQIRDALGVDGGKTTASGGQLQDNIEKGINNIEIYMLRALGLMQENQYLDQTIYTDYQGIKLLTSGRIRIYSSAGSVGTANDVIATYQITTTWTNDEMTSYKVVKI